EHAPANRRNNVPADRVRHEHEHTGSLMGTKGCPLAVWREHPLNPMRNEIIPSVLEQRLHPLFRKEHNTAEYQERKYWVKDDLHHLGVRIEHLLDRDFIPRMGRKLRDRVRDQRPIDKQW